MNEINIETRLAVLENTQENMSTKMVEIEKKVNHHDKIYDMINRISTNIEVMCEQMKNMNGDITSVKNDVVSVKGEINEIKSKPAKNWDKLAWAVGGVIVTAVVTLICREIGLM